MTPPGDNAPRILWIDAAGGRGGAARSLAEVVPRLAARGMDVAAALPPGDAAESLASVGVPVFPLPTVRLRRSLLHSGLPALLSARAALRRAIAEFRPAILHANTLAAALLLPRSANARVVLHVRDTPRPGLPFRLATSRADCLVAISPYILLRLALLLPGRMCDIDVVPNGIDIPRFDSAPSRAAAREALGLPAGAPVVGMVAHIAPWKRHDLFLRAAAMLRSSFPDAVWVVAGGDLFGEHAAYVRRLRRFADAAGLSPSLRLLGDVHDIPSLLPAFDLLVHPAGDEPFGRVVCEAMACGVPAVVRDDAGPASIVKDGRTGWLLHSDDPSELAVLVASLLSRPSDLAATGAAARKAVRGRFSADRVAHDLSRLYRELS